MALNPTVSWNRNIESDLARYILFYGTSPNKNYATFVNLPVPTRPQYTFPDGILKKYVTNYFYIGAVDSSGNQSGGSTEVSTFVSGGLLMKF